MPISLGDDEVVDIQMTPLIDCVFLLIIFFLVATTMKKIEKEVPLELPEAHYAIQKPIDQDVLIISLDSAGAIYLDSERATLEALHQRLRTVATTNKFQRIRVDCDRATPYQHLVHVLDLCQFEGLKNVGLGTANDRRR